MSLPAPQNRPLSYLFNKQEQRYEWLGCVTTFDSLRLQ